jgi:hypothetical protein
MEPSASHRSLPRSEDLVRFQQEPPGSSLGGLGPKTKALLGALPPVSSLGGLDPKTKALLRSRAVDLVRRLPRSEDQRNSRAGSIASAGTRNGPEGPSLLETVPKARFGLPWPRLWHKVEHVHPGALRGRAVGSAPSIRRTLENGPSLALQSRLQRLRDAPCSPRQGP